MYMWDIIVLIIIGLLWINQDMLWRWLGRSEDDQVNDLFLAQEPSKKEEPEPYVITETSNEIIDNVLKKIEY
jgi:hypothetical protein